MVLPLIVAGVTAASAISQYINSKEAREASAQERRDLKDLLDNLGSPNFNPRLLTPEQFRVVGKYVPEAANFVAEQAPQLVQQAGADSVQARNAQREALGRLRAQSRGEDPLADAELAEAMAQAGTANRGRLGAVKEDFARRGQGGGTSEMLAQLVGAQTANQLASDGSRAAFIDAQKRKLQAMRDTTSLAGNIREEDYRTERGNNDVINSFNERTSSRRQRANETATATANEGQRFNLNAEQGVAEKNVATANDFKINERSRGDKFAQLGFENQMSKVRAQSGITDMARSDVLNGARDRNSAISGATQAVGAYYGAKSTEKPQQTTERPMIDSNEFEDQDSRNPMRRKYRFNEVPA